MTKYIPGRIAITFKKHVLQDDAVALLNQFSPQNLQLDWTQHKATIQVTEGKENEVLEALSKMTEVVSADRTPMRIKL